MLPVTDLQSIASAVILLNQTFPSTIMTPKFADCIRNRGKGNEIYEIGVGLAGFGIAFLFLGVLLLFDKGLLAIGNILFICGLAFVIGLERTFRFFFQQHKMKATAAFMGGILVVLLGWPLIGMIIETYGFILLFGGFLPVAVNFLRRVPVIGTLLSLPGISSLVNKVGEPQGMV